MTKTILITGGAGFIGSHLCKRLLDEGNRVISVDNFLTGSEDNVDDLKKNKDFRSIRHDIVFPLKIDERIDEIYNLACPASPVHYQADPIHTTKTSVLGSLNMLDLAQKNNARILHASTSEVYGDPLEHPQKESYFGNVNPNGIRSCYDEGKRCAESLFFDHHRKYGLDARVIRIFNTYGPNMHPADGRVVSNFIMQALRGEDLTAYGAGDQTRSFQYVDDLVEGIVRMMDNKAGFLGPVNLGNPNEFTINELAQKILNMIPESRSKIIYRPLPEDDPKQRRPDISLAKKMLDWEPKIQLDEGLERTISYFKGKL